MNYVLSCKVIVFFASEALFNGIICNDLHQKKAPEGACLLNVAFRSDGIGYLGDNRVPQKTLRP